MHQKQVILGSSMSTSVPQLANPVLHQRQALHANAVAGASAVFGSPHAGLVWGDLILNDRVVDLGLVTLAAVNAIYICDGNPSDVANLDLVGYGVKTGVTFGAPVTTAGGRKVTSNAVVNGVITSTGFVSRWAAVDTVAGRILATGALDAPGPVAIASGFTWSLEPIIIHRPRSE
jgi:hypothetical protein